MTYRKKKKAPERGILAFGGRKTLEKTRKPVGLLIDTEGRDFGVKF